MDPDQSVEVAYASRGLDLDLGGYTGPHERQILNRGSLVAVGPIGLLHEPVSRRGLHPIGTGPFTDLAETPLEGIPIKASSPLGQEVVLEDDLDPGPVPMGLQTDDANFLLDVVPVPTEGLTDVEDHVDFLCPIPAGQFRLMTLRFRCGAPMGKPDHGTNEHSAALQPLHCLADRVGLDADGGHPIPGGQPASLFQFSIGKRWMQQRMIDHLRQRFVGQFHDVQTLG